MMEDDGAVFTPLVGPGKNGVLLLVWSQKVDKQVLLLPQLSHVSHGIQGEGTYRVT